MCYDVYGKSNADVETFLLMLYHFYHFSKENVNWFKLWGCTVWTLNKPFNSCSSFRDQWIKFLPLLLLIQLLQVYERVFRGESVNLFCYKGWSGGKQTRREAGGPSAVQRKTWVIYSSVTTQRVNIKHSSSKSWRMVHSESSHFPILPLLHNTNAQRPKSFFATLNLCNSSLENWDI